MTTTAGVRSGLRTVLLGSRDLDRSAAFYRDLLGFPEVPAPPGAPRPARRFSAGDVQIHVTHIGPDGSAGAWVNDDLQAGIRHFGMKVSDIDDRIERLRAAGVRVLSPPADVLGGVRIAFFLDPDGARLEFIQGNLEYQQVYAPALAQPSETVVDGPRFDHVAVTVPDLAAALRSWGDLGFEVIGEIRHHDDPRGFLMTYLQAGPAVLEVFSFDVPTLPDPVGAQRGFRGIEVWTGGKPLVLGGAR
jgi:catechol 2,3-dioxygenase-like lactoylglutathione lyase family enzyme